METLTKRLGSLRKNRRLDKVIEKVGWMAADKYPNVYWTAVKPDETTLDVYGDGFILKATKGIFSKEYFILADDPRKEKWIDMIMAQIEEEIEKNEGKG